MESRQELSMKCKRMARIPAYTVMNWDDFQVYPESMHNLFQSRNGTYILGRRHYSEVVMDMCGPEKKTKLRPIKVTSVEDLQRLIEELFNKPILFHAYVKHTREYGIELAKLKQTWDSEFAVLINTRHIFIKEKLENELSKAMAFMQQGRNFCLKLDFGPSVNDWFSKAVDKEPTGCNFRENKDSGHMTLCITNKTSPIDCCMNPGKIFMICPCWLPLWLCCGGCCYYTHRRRTIEDFGHSFYNVPVHQISTIQTVTP